jgi:hypothetical protein
MTLPLLAVLLGISFALGLLVGTALVSWWLPYRLARRPGELDSLAIRVLQTHQHHLQRQARRASRRGRHRRAVRKGEGPAA